MSYSIISAILLATIALSTSSVPFTTRDRNVLARFYPNFAQFYRPVTLQSSVDSEQGTVLYTFYFTEREYVSISEKSLTLIYTDVIERTITYHPMPNFEVVGSRYFYRRDRKQNSTVEIELVNPEDRLFRYVDEPNRYFYLTSLDNLEYLNQMPVMPYYEVTFLCNSSLSTTTMQAPLLSYIDRSFQYTPRYSIDLPLTNTDKQTNMYAFTDIRNNGEQPIVVKGAELIAGDMYLNKRSLEYLLTIFSSDLSAYKTDASGAYIYQLTNSASITIPAHSMKSIQFFQTNVTVESYAYYSSVFMPTNSRGKLSNAYNITLFNDYLPHGRLFLYEQGRYLGQISLPDLSKNETCTIIFGSHTDVSYRRQVKVIESDENTGSITYSIEYTFENFKLSRDVRVYFTESFSLFKYIQVQNLSISNEQTNLPDLVLSAATLRGYINLPRQNPQKILSFNLIIYKYPPNVNDDN